MGCEVLISGNRYLCLELKPNDLSTRRRSTTQTCLCVCLNYHQIKPSFWIENRVSSVGSSRLRTKAAINDEFVVAASAAEMSFYELLGISESGSVSEIKQAYKQLARKYHPDVCPPDRTEEYTKRFLQVQEAYETLSDPTRRALYDRDLAMGLHLAFSARKTYHHSKKYDEGLMDTREWRNRWQSQLTELKRKSMNKMDSRDDMSWGARMRRQRNESVSSSVGVE